MFRAILCGAVVSGVAIGTLTLAPSASAEPVCVYAAMNHPTPLSTGYFCYMSYPLGTTCASPGVTWGTTVDVQTYVCVPGILAAQP